MAPRRRQEDIDRFIPNRSAMGLGFSHAMLTQRDNKEEDFGLLDSLSRETYEKKLAEALGVNRHRILAFNNKQSPWKEPLSPSFNCQRLRDIPQRPRHTYDIFSINPTFSLNLADWSSNNLFCIGVLNEVTLWKPSCFSSTKVDIVVNDDEDIRVTSVSWAPNGRQLAVGLKNSHVQLWDTCTSKLLRTFTDGHTGRVGSLAWNNHILTTGGHDAQIINHDVRLKCHNVVATYRGHSGEIDGLKWSDSGERLASGGEDGLIHIWDRSMASLATLKQKQWLHRLAEHKGKVKALAWCPYKMNWLASGGDESDKCIKFWNTWSGACVNSIDTGSQVSALLWNKNKPKELLSSHGSSQNQLKLWQYPSMRKMAELSGHTDGVVCMAESPDGCTVASASADRTVCLWDVFGNSRPKGRSSNDEPFANYYFSCIR